MIFVTVGTHEQQFDRLIRAADELVANGQIHDDVFIQTGYSTYCPQSCEWSQFLEFEEMSSKMRDADVVVTHGGPSSFMEAMAAGKVPVVVPRRMDFGEHVNDHQANFVRMVSERQGGIVPVYNIDELLSAIERARDFSRGVVFQSHNTEFCLELRRLLEEI